MKTTGGALQGLSQVATDDLRQLLAALRNGALRAPLSKANVSLNGYGRLWPHLEPYAELTARGLELLLDAVLSERSRPQRRLELVWSGTDAGWSHARYTAVVVPELFTQASVHVTLAGYSFDHGATMFEPLHRAMRDRSVVVRLFVDVEQLYQRLRQQLRSEKRTSRLEPVRHARTSSSEEYAHAVCSLFRELYWPFGAPFPEIYYDPRSAESHSIASLHAKCIVVDHEVSLITSANFTSRGQQRNIEVGVLIRDRTFATSLEQQWFNLMHSGGVVRWG